MGTSQKFLLDYFRRCQKVLSRIALGADAKAVFSELQTIVESMEPGRTASVLQLNPSTKTLHSYVSNRLPKPYADAIEGIEIGEFVGCCGAAVYLAQTVIAEDLQTHPNWRLFRDITKAANLEACWSVPIELSDGHIFGSFAIYSNEKSLPTDEELEILTMAAHIGSVAIEKTLLEEKLRFAATHDVLTGLLNRTQFEMLSEKMRAHLERRQLSMSLLFLDLNHFKDINDQYGHDLGDDLLILFAKVLANELRESDIVCRRGGDEFLVALSGTSKQGAEMYVSRVRKCFEKEVVTLKLPRKVEFAAGIAETASAPYLSLDRLIIKADQNMYKHKAQMKKRSAEEMDRRFLE